MDHEFTVQEIKDAAGAARIYCPGFSEEKFESLMELERRIDDPAYLQAVQGLIRLEEENGVSCVDAIDACERLMEQKIKLEREVPDLEKRAGSLVAQIKQAIVEYEQIKKVTAKAGQELAQIRSEYAATEKKLEALDRKVEKEKQRIGKEIEDCYWQANVTKEEVVTAGKVKAEVESQGFTLDLALGLSKEFADHKNAREKLAEGLKEHGSLNKYLDNLVDWGNKERARVLTEISVLESQKKGLSDESVHLRNILSQLQADVDGEENLRRFYRRYVGLSGLMDQLATWEQVYFMRCGNPVNMTAGVFDKKYGNPHFWTDKPPITCPHCGYQRLYFDKKIYQYLNWPAERPLKITLGE